MSVSNKLISSTPQMLDVCWWLGCYHREWLISTRVTYDTISRGSPAPCLVAVNNPAAPLQSPHPAGVVVNITLKFPISELYLFTGMVMETPVMGRLDGFNQVLRCIDDRFFTRTQILCPKLHNGITIYNRVAPRCLNVSRF